ncbi:unnamed protein product [Rotaria sordida]|uniref:Uncharacterized protein n=1 Tax=Rotaria sordida TaxID=392033 RepID=A0A814JFK3_9BILA|nr:unnamed protein product [Rotaria sordida]CAF1497684.1 unnamed protein product [Rotaria sordida]
MFFKRYQTTKEENLELTTLFLLDLNTTKNANDILIPEINVSPPVNSVLHEIIHTYDPFCWRHLYGRGIGHPIHTCPNDSPDQDGLLCYPLCRTGYNGVGPVCWKKCENITSIGFACIDISISERSCPWYDKCGIFRRSCVSCPENYTKLGCFCGQFYLRDNYGRGIGSSLICSEDNQQIGLLCYEKCKKTYNSIGSMCLQNCPSTHTYSCYGGCSTTKEICDSQIKNMTQSAIRTSLVILNIIMGLPIMSTNIFDIISNIAKNDWTQAIENLLFIAKKLAQQILPILTQKFLRWSFDKIESATKNASLIITATAMKDQNILSPFLKFFHLDSFISTFNHTYCEISNDDF